MKRPFYIGMLVFIFIFTFAFISQNLAQETKTIIGKIVSIDKAHKTITISQEFSFDEKSCDLSQVKSGDTVEVIYQIKEGKSTVISITKVKKLTAKEKTEEEVPEEEIPMEGC